MKLSGHLLCLVEFVKGCSSVEERLKEISAEWMAKSGCQHSRIEWNHRVESFRLEKTFRMMYSS